MSKATIRAGLVLACMLSTGCADEGWVRALDDAPENAADATGVSERIALDGLGAPSSGSLGADPSPAYLGENNEADNQAETARILHQPSIDLGGAVRLAELNSKDLVASYQAIVAAHGQTIAAGTYPDPNFAFASGPLSPHGLFSQADGGSTHTIPMMPQATYTFTQPIVTGLRLVWATREAVANEWAARATWQALHRTNVQNVKVAYVNLVYANANAKLQDGLLELAKNLDHMAERQLDAGTIAAPDRMQAAVVLASQRAQTETAHQAIAVAEASLAGLLGGVTVRGDQVTGDLTYKLALAPESSLESAMLQGHPVIRASELAVSAADADTHLQRAVIWPDVGISLGYERDYLDSPPNKGFDVINLGFTFNLPIWDRNQGARVTSDANLLGARATLQFTITGLQSSLRSSYANVLAQEKQAEELDRNVIPIAQKTLDLVVRSFQVGRSSMIDVLNARQSLASAQSQLIAALQSLDQSVAGIESLTGEPLLQLQ